MSANNTDDVALLLIDVQKGLDDPDLGRRNNPDAEANMALLLAEWRRRGLPVIHIRHCSVEAGSKLRPELPGNDYKDEVRPLPGEKEFTKTVNSAFIGTGLEDHLQRSAISKLVIVGLTTDHCVSASTRMASDLGFDVILVADATAAFERCGYDGRQYAAEDIHRVNLVSLDEEFCAVRTTAEVLGALT
ncbi:MAG: cysteine hydrolase [Gammaproteobacteria bacterium]|nr:cysteine hydrolase [Gammaproteobacteria bacterium]MDH3446995.1 cysteine hydrolase [Gammaproteobacteria bacterium]